MHQIQLSRGRAIFLGYKGNKMVMESVRCSVFIWHFQETDSMTQVKS